jgi:hypothetical protein
VVCGAQEENYSKVSKALNSEYLRYDYMCRRLQDDGRTALETIRKQAEDKRDAFQAKFRGTPRTIEKVCSSCTELMYLTSLLLSCENSQ